MIGQIISRLRHPELVSGSMHNIQVQMQNQVQHDWERI
jgi:hypothetical protein